MRGLRSFWLPTSPSEVPTTLHDEEPLFDPALFTAPPNERFQQVVMRRTATREIFQVNFETHRGRTWSIFGNHWPSRSGGQMESAGCRAIAGETLAYFRQRVWEVHGPATPALAMGDFNDEPSDLSLVQYALSTRQQTKVLGGTSPRLWNLIWDILGNSEGSFFENFANLLDQSWSTRTWPDRPPLSKRPPGSVEILRFPGMVSTGTYPAPVPFGGMGKPVNPNGFSDHFPIAMEVCEADKAESAALNCSTFRAGVSALAKFECHVICDRQADWPTPSMRAELPIRKPELAALGLTRVPPHIHQLGDHPRDALAQHISVLAGQQLVGNLGSGHPGPLGHRGAPFVDLMEQNDDLGRRGGRTHIRPRRPHTPHSATRPTLVM